MILMKTLNMLTFSTHCLCLALTLVYSDPFITSPLKLTIQHRRKYSLICYAEIWIVSYKTGEHWHLQHSSSIELRFHQSLDRFFIDL